MEIIVVIAILVTIASAVWVIKRKKVETLETRIARLKETITTAEGVKIKPEKGVEVSIEAMRAIENGIKHTQKKVFAKYNRSLLPAAYTVAYIKGEPDSNGDPAFRLPVGDYKGTDFDKGGYILVAGQTVYIGADTNIIVLPEHRSRYGHLELAASYEAEHVELAWFDGDEYERTKYHGTGVGHPIILENK